jgi:hypothetical protein
MDYLIVLRFEHESVEVRHSGSLRDALKAAWAVCRERRQNPLTMTMLDAEATPVADDSDGWATVSPVERMD